MISDLLLLQKLADKYILSHGTFPNFSTTWNILEFHNFGAVMVFDTTIRFDARFFKTALKNIRFILSLGQS